MNFMKLNIQLFAVTKSISCDQIGDYDINNNRTVERITFTVTKTTGNTWWGDPKTVTFIVDGNTYYSSITLNYSAKTASCYVDVPITHNPDGSKYLEYSASVVTGTSAGTVSASGGKWLTQIPRQANITGANDFTDEENPYMTFANSGGLPMNARLEFADTNIARNDIPNTGNYTFILTDNERNLLRGKCTTNSLVVKYVIATKINGVETFYSTVDKMMTIVNGSPIFTDFTYKDKSSNISQITGNNQILIANKSILEVTISSEQKMVAQKQAIPSRYTFEIDGKNLSANYSNDTITVEVGSLVNDGIRRLNVRAFDSRNNPTLVYKDITVIPYSSPNIYITAERLNNFEKQTTISCKGTYSKVLISNENKNTISSIKYHIREENGEWSEWNNMTFTVDEEKAEYQCSDVYVNLDNTKSFEIEIQVSDILDTYAGSQTVDIGKPLFFISDNLQCIGVNCIPLDDAAPGTIWFEGSDGIIKQVLDYEIVDEW